MPLKRTVAPVLLALDIDDVKSHLNITTDDDDILLTGFIGAASLHLENITETALLTQTYELKLNKFENCIKLEKPPLQSVTSIKYYDENQIEQTLAASVYDVDTHSLPGRVTLAYNQSWPSITEITNGITITYVAGYTEAALIPNTLKLAMLLHVGHMDANRESSSALTIKNVPMGYDALISHYKMGWI